MPGQMRIIFLYVGKVRGLLAALQEALTVSGTRRVAR